jgi:N-acetylmuramoyl-L-alanine amidase
MSYDRIVISSGHGLYVRGANGIIDEVDEARLVVEALAAVLTDYGVEVITFHDDVSKNQSQNLWTITDFHNSIPEPRLDISVHFNAFEQRAQPVGTEVWYCTQEELARKLSAAMATVGFIDRGAKGGKDVELHFLNQTTAPSVLLEVCFVDSSADCDIYQNSFEALIEALAGELVGEDAKEVPQQFYVEGKASWFGGPTDTTGVTSSEGLAFIYTTEDKPVLFLSYQPEGTTGLARRLNPEQPYVACRWPYDAETKPKWRELLLTEMALVEAPKTGKKIKCYPADWGPAGPESGHDTGRAADLSPSALEYLGIETDDEVIVTFPCTHRA